jgi:hypothetical protein
MPSPERLRVEATSVSDASAEGTQKAELAGLQPNPFAISAGSAASGSFPGRCHHDGRAGRSTRRSRRLPALCPDITTTASVSGLLGL